MPDTPRGSAAGPTWHGTYHPNGHCPTGECAELHVKAVLDTATTYELQGGALLGEAELRMSEARSRLQHASDLRASVDRCHHCGRPDEVDGDHSCSCPHRDDECKFHPQPEAQSA